MEISSRLTPIRTPSSVVVLYSWKRSKPGVSRDMLECQAEKVPLEMPICGSSGRTSNGLGKPFGGMRCMSIWKTRLKVLSLMLIAGFSIGIGMFLAQVAEKLAILACNWLF